MTANQVNITEGSGKSVATETIGGLDYQKVKVVGGETGSTSVLGITPDGSMKVSVIGAIQIVNLVSSSFLGKVQGLNTTIPASVTAAAPFPIAGGDYTYSAAGGVQIPKIDNTGNQYVVFQPTSLISGAPSVITGTASVLILSAPTSTSRNYVTNITVTNGATVSTIVNIVDNGQVIWTGYAAASGGGFAPSFPTPLKQPTSGLALYAQTPTQASVLVSMSGYTAP